MLSSVFMVGEVGEVIDDCTRYIGLEKVDAIHDVCSVDQIPVRHWSRNKGSYFMKLENGVMISLRGRIERDPKIGLVIVVEQFVALGKDRTLVFSKE